MSEKPAKSTPEDPFVQPMGPLEEGDQALVDVVRDTPQGSTGASYIRGSAVRVQNYNGALRTEVTHDGIKEEASVGVNLLKDEGHDGKLSAGAHEYDVDFPFRRDKQSSMQVRGNEVLVAGEDTESGMPKWVPDRAQAQAKKLEVAHKIEAAKLRLEETKRLQETVRPHLGQVGVNAANRPPAVRERQ